jgi:hypothetical protein
MPIPCSRDDFWPYTVLRTSISGVKVSPFSPDFLLREERKPHECKCQFQPVCVRCLIVPGFQVLSVYDLSSEEAQGACRRMRHYVSLPIPLEETLTQAISILGGRLAYLNRVSRAYDMVEMARHMLVVEKGWLLGRIGLIQDCDDDVMDEVRLANVDIGLI